MEKTKLKPEDIEIVSQDVALWREVKKNAENEIANTEQIYFKNITFNKAIAELAQRKLEDLGDKTR